MCGAEGMTDGRKSHEYHILRIPSHTLLSVIQPEIPDHQHETQSVPTACVTIYNSQDVEATEVSINRWIDKEDVVCIHNGIVLSHKKTMFFLCMFYLWQIMPFAAIWMGLLP